MGLLRPEDWRAKWIAFRPPAEAAPPAINAAELRWIWFPGDPAQNVPKADRFFRRLFDVSGRITRAEIFITADNRFSLSVNGRKVGGGGSWDRFERFDLKDLIVPGRNVLAVTAGNEDGPAGLIGQLQVEVEDGPALRLSTDASWKCSNRSASGWHFVTFDYSAWEAAKELAPLGGGPWQDKLSVRNIGGVPANPSPLLRKTFAVTGKVRRARIYSTALGLYELYLNGRRVGEDRLTPGWTDFNKRLQVQTYDVTDQLVQGENALGAILGDGWCFGKIGWLQRGHGVYGPGPARLLLQLQVDYEEGRRETIISDGSWKAILGPIRGSDLLDGEIYDARMEQLGWARLRVKGPSGTIVTLRFAEMLNPDGTIYTANLRKAKCTDQYILRGGDEEVWEPRFTFHGFRYVELTGYPGRPGLDAVTGRVAHSEMTPTGVFECSNDMVNLLQRNIVWGQRGNFLSVPTDCPQRDERLGWMGAQIFIRTACFNYDVASFFTKWVRDVVDAQNPDGSFADVSPRLPGALPADASPAWGDAGVICPWTIYQC